MVWLGVQLLVLTVLGAAFVVAHLALLVATWTSEASSRDRWLALVPLLLPVVAFRAGKKAGTIVWVVLLTSYLVVRFVLPRVFG